MTLLKGVYDVREALKLLSIDTETTDRHITFLMNLYRSIVIRQFITNNPGEHRDMLTQTLYMELELVDTSRFPQYSTTGFTFLSTKKVLPNIIGQQMYKEIEVRTLESLGMEVEILAKSRVSEIKYAPTGFIYGFKEDDGKLYIIGKDSIYKSLKSITVTAILEDPEDILDTHNLSTDLLIYPITSHLWGTTKDMVVQHILREMSIPVDIINNNKDEQLQEKPSLQG